MSDDETSVSQELLRKIDGFLGILNLAVLGSGVGWIGAKLCGWLLHWTTQVFERDCLFVLTAALGVHLLFAFVTAALAFAFLMKLGADLELARMLGEGGRRTTPRGVSWQAVDKSKPH